MRMKMWSTILLVLILAPSCFAESLPQHIQYLQPNICKVHNGGTGTYLGGCLVLTAAHVVRGDRDGVISLTFHDGPKCKGKVESFSEKYDFACVRIPRPIKTIRGVPLAHSIPKIGSKVWKAGYIRGKLFWSKGTIKNRLKNGWILITPYSVGGQSGGPIVTEEGHLIGNIWGRDRSISTIGVGAELTHKVLGGKVVEGLFFEHTQCQYGACQTRNGLFGGILRRSSNSGQNSPPPGSIQAENPPQGEFLQPQNLLPSNLIPQVNAQLGPGSISIQPQLQSQPQFQSPPSPEQFDNSFSFQEGQIAEPQDDSHRMQVAIAELLGAVARLQEQTPEEQQDIEWGIQKVLNSGGGLWGWIILAFVALVVLWKKYMGGGNDPSKGTSFPQQTAVGNTSTVGQPQTPIQNGPSVAATQANEGSRG